MYVQLSWYSACGVSLRTMKFQVYHEQENFFKFYPQKYAAICYRVCKVSLQCMFLEEGVIKSATEIVCLATLVLC